MIELLLDSSENRSKFEEGVLRADGCTKRFEAHGHEILRPEVVYSRKAEADEAKQLNQWHMLLNKFPNMSTSCLFKTAEVRKAELEAILERSMR